MFAEFMNTYGLQIVYMLVTAIAGAIGIMIKNIYTKYVNNQTKKDVVRTVVLGVEQIYKDLHGPDKLAQALTAAAAMLIEKGINVTDLELRMMIEATVAEFNDAFHKGEADPAVTTEIVYE
jgi:hypothetical protein